LWAPPAFEDRASLAAAAAAAGANLLHDEAAFTHVFTHFRLVVHPVRAWVDRPCAVTDSTQRWLTPEEALGLGLPTPVRKLLRSAAAPGDDALPPRRRAGRRGSA
jgi:A/G-specific adenine glycosylase